MTVGNHKESGSLDRSYSTGNWGTISQYSEFMRAKNQFFIKGKMTAEEFAAELDREWAAAIHGASDKDIWIEEYDDE